MNTEFEAKILDIDAEAIADLIFRNGGEARGQRLLRRYVYDIERGDASRWLRLRDTGDEVTLTVKSIRGEGIDGTREVELTVGDFDVANELLMHLGFSPKAYQESRRTSFVLGDARLELDEWPGIPAYLEIEAGSAEDVLSTAARLGISRDRLTSENTIAIYRRYGMDLNTIPDLRFQESATPARRDQV